MVPNVFCLFRISLSVVEEMQDKQAVQFVRCRDQLLGAHESAHDREGMMAHNSMCRTASPFAAPALLTLQEALPPSAVQGIQIGSQIPYRHSLHPLPSTQHALAHLPQRFECQISFEDFLATTARTSTPSQPATCTQLTCKARYLHTMSPHPSAGTKELKNTDKAHPEKTPRSHIK